jgi:hypothetical protein
MISGTPAVRHARSTPFLHFAAGVGLLLVYGVVMAATNSSFPFQDDEIRIIVNANYPVQHTVQLFASGIGQHEHPPLYDLLLHFWLRLTGSRMDMLRLPSIAFFLAGLWTLAAIARRAAGWRGYWVCLALGVLWPLGFQYGRLAGWYSFCFFLVALMTYNYVRLPDDWSATRWFKLGLCCGALIYTNYFGWPMIACLAIDYFLLKQSHKSLHWKPAGILGASLLLAFLPLAPSFFSEVKARIGGQLSSGTWHIAALLSLAREAAKIFAISFFTLSAGESVGLWLWLVSIPVMIALLICFWLVVRRSPAQARRIFLYGLLVLGAMSLLGLSGEVPRIFFLAPWILLPVAVVLGTCELRWDHVALVSSLVVIAGAGWLGIRNTNYVAKWDVIEPWQQVTKELEKDMANGDAVATSDPRFYFYLNYDLGFAERGSDWAYLGRDTYLSKGIRVYEASSEMEPASYNGASKVIAVGRWPYRPEPDHWLNAKCTLKSVRMFVPDPQHDLKKRYYPATKQQPNPFQVVEYDCVPRNAQPVIGAENK